jgi:hypothetical protein
MDTIADIVGRLATPKLGRTEADLQSDVRKLLLDAPLSIDDDDVAEIALEAQVGGGRRIDVEIGSAAIECKRTLNANASDLKKWEAQLAGYVRDRTEQLERRYIGILTDGARWRLYHLIPDGSVAYVDELKIADGGDADRLISWLDAVLATNEHLTPTPELITRRLGAGSPSFELDLADLHALYAAVKDDPEVRVKRELWTRLLSAALGTNFEANDGLFVTHTYLVLTAELIAHAVMAIPVDVPGGNVRELLEGQVFDQAGLHGIVEADFFDWPAVADEGAPIIRAIGRRLGRFDWTQVGHDVMKALYESVIDTDTRQQLGEYYTPDWLAQRMVHANFTDPATQRLLDPSCGSGTFLFWAVREALGAYEAQGLANADALALLVQRVHGIDLHPVAVTLARVTYLLAIGPERLKDRGELTIPVFLGDSVRWEQENTLFSDGGITIKTTDGMELFDDRQLHFPEGVLTDPERFDRLVDDLATRAAKRAQWSTPPSIAGILNRHKVPTADREAVERAFAQLCHLHDAGRNHIWGYYVRNLARPLSFTRPEGRADVLIGNPPWLAYRKMPPEIQQRYKVLAKARGLWAGGPVATHQDLSDLFVSRAVEQYLRPDGHFAFVMPASVMSRRQYTGFRTGDWTNRGAGELKVAFAAPEDFSLVKPPLFPVPSAVIAGKPTTGDAVALPAAGIQFTGRLKSHQVPWDDVADKLTKASSTTILGNIATNSPYRASFTQGAVLTPRFLMTVVDDDASPLGVPQGRRAIRSARSSNEKKPWKLLESMTAVVESEFVFPVHLGETIVSYREREPLLSVLPFVDGRLLDGKSDALDQYPGLASWWRRAEQIWNLNGTGKMSLLESIDFQSKLRKQFPLAEHRVAYTKGGQHLAATRIADPLTVIDHKLYWGACHSVDEARYVTAVLNSNPVIEAAAPLQARGQHNPRDFDLYVFALPFPAFDAASELQSRIVELSARAEALVASLELNPNRSFQTARRVTRDALVEDGVAGEIDELVTELVPG